MRYLSHCSQVQINEYTNPDSQKTVIQDTVPKNMQKPYSDPSIDIETSMSMDQSRRG